MFGEHPSILYKKVLFENVSSETMKAFIAIYDINDMACKIWNNLSHCLVKSDCMAHDVKKYFKM